MSQGIPQATKQGMGGCAKAAIGCGVVCLIFIGLGVAGVFWVINNPREAQARLFAFGAEKVVEEMKIPEEQKEQMITTIEKIKQDFIDEKITEGQAKRVFMAIIESPLFKQAIVLVVEQAYFDQSGLSPEEIEAGRVTLRRLIYGVANQQISEERLNEVLDLISTQGRNSQRQIEDTVSDEQLRAFLKDAKAAADEAEIAEDIPEINFADELDKAVELGLSGDPLPSEIERQERIDEINEPGDEGTDTEATDTEATDTEVE